MALPNDKKMLKSGGGRPARRSRHAVGVCATCLAADRTLFSLRKTPQYVNICSGLTLSTADKVCFECRAKLGNFVKFRSRALRAEELLACVPPSCNLKIPNIFSTSGIKCLSTLTETFVSPYNTIYIDRSLDGVKEEDCGSDSEVKQEVSESLLMTVESHFTPMEDSFKTVNCRSTEDGKATDVKITAEDTLEVDVDLKQQNYQTEFVVRPIDRSELLAYFERERATKRYKSAPYKCHTCALPFRLEEKLNIHNQLHSEERGNFKCEICKQRCKDSATLKQHTVLHYRSYGCPRCPRTDYNLHRITLHYKQVHDDVTARACRKCPARFTTALELRRHVRKRHEKHVCHLCNRQYTSKLGLDRHLRHSHTKVRPLQCPFCHKTYKGALNLKAHVRNYHETPSEHKREDAYCAECDIQFKDQYRYKTHLKSSKHLSDGEFNYCCDHCGKTYAQKMSLISHIEEKHLKLARYKCDVCDERFHSKAYALKHSRKRHSDRPKINKHVCEICEKAFAIPKSLRDHMNIHNGVRPYECEQCGATFAYSAALYNHNQLVHLKKKRGSRALD